MNKTALFLAVLCVALLGSNAYLIYVNHELIEQHQIDQAIQLPTLNAPMTPITVRGVQGAKRPLVFNPDTGHDHLLLVMSPDCPYCKKNWPMWDTLIKDVGSNVDVTYFDVTGKFDKHVSAAHHIRDDQLITASIDSAIKARIIGTPTTILVASDGKVKHVWPGVLDAGEVGEIVALSK
jgi:hypothetical protein